MIEKFDGDYAFLSNFYPANIEFLGDVYATSEHLYQAMKTLDSAKRRFIRGQQTPGKAKRVGQKIVSRSDWNEVKEEVMLQVMRMKFFQNYDAAVKLLETGSKILVEGNNWHDNFWGICDCNYGSCVSWEHPQNKLGKILMQVRDEIKVFGIEN